jgi:hypothetical protein
MADRRGAELPPVPGFRDRGLAGIRRLPPRSRVAATYREVTCMPVLALGLGIGLVGLLVIILIIVLILRLI